MLVEADRWTSRGEGRPFFVTRVLNQCTSSANFLTLPVNVPYLPSLAITEFFLAPVPGQAYFFVCSAVCLSNTMPQSKGSAQPPGGEENNASVQVKCALFLGCEMVSLLAGKDGAGSQELPKPILSGWCFWRGHKGSCR